MMRQELTHHRIPPIFWFFCPLRSPNSKTVHAGLRRGIFNGKFKNLSIQRTDTRVIPVHMQCLGHKHSIHGVIASWSFRWIKQFTHLSVAKIGPRGGIFNGKVWNYAIKRTDTSAQAAHMHCMDHGHAIHRVKACSSFPWIKQSTHLSVEKFGTCGIFNGKVWNYAIQRTDTSVQAAHMHCMGHWYAIRGVKACSSFRWIKQFTHLSVAKLLIESKNRGRVIPVLSRSSYRYYSTYLLYSLMILLLSFPSETY